MQTQTLTEKRSATVLVVDDQNASRSILTELLQNITPKVSIIQKSHPQEALDWAVHHAVDLVLVDYSMPDMNGIHFTRILRTIEAYRYIPIMMVTIVDDKAIKQQALEAGVTDFLSKPLNLEECITRCQNLLSMQHQQVHLSQERTGLEQQLSEAKQYISQIEHETVELLLHALYPSSAQLQRTRRIAHYAKLLSEVSGLSTQEQTQLEQAALLFEIDKIQHPTEHDTSEHDTRLSKSLPSIKQLLSQSQSALLKKSAEIASYVQEPFSTGREPNLSKASNIPLSARIVAIAAHFDQVSYPSAASSGLSESGVTSALTSLASNAGIQFDPYLVKQLVTIQPRLERVYEDYLANKND